MAEHLQTAHDLQLAIAQGRLANARSLAHWFASHPMQAQSGWRSYIDDMRDAAHEIERAQDVASAGLQLGRVGFACGSCHETSGGRPMFSYGPLPREVDDALDAQMERHQWAAKRLWEGVIGPSDREWMEGATVIAANILDVRRMAHEKPNAEVSALAERLQMYGRQAQDLRTLSERARFYGDMMSTCAGCHQILRPHPVGLGRED